MLQLTLGIFEATFFLHSFLYLLILPYKVEGNGFKRQKGVRLYFVRSRNGKRVENRLARVFSQ